MANSSIEWTQMTWNPTTGCSKISAGCKFCYAEVMAKRLKAMGVEKYEAGFGVAMHENELQTPHTWRKPQLVFVNSMSDLFHEGVTSDFIARVFHVMNQTPRHTYQVLTKRSERLLELDEQMPLSWSNNIWMGVSIEDCRVMHRLEDLRSTRAFVRFLSLEPLIGPLKNLDLTGIHWVIVGGESGWTPREMKTDWINDIFDACKEQGVPFFFKQWGGKRKKWTGRTYRGQTWDEMPDIMRLAQTP